MTEICNDVRIEPGLQPLTDQQFDNATTITQDGTRVDISAVQWILERDVMKGPFMMFEFSTLMRLRTGNPPSLLATKSMKD